MVSDAPALAVMAIEVIDCWRRRLAEELCATLVTTSPTYVLISFILSLCSSFKQLLIVFFYELTKIFTRFEEAQTCFHSFIILQHCVVINLDFKLL